MFLISRSGPIWNKPAQTGNKTDVSEKKRNKHASTLL